jgi:Transposase DDE domain
LGSFLNWKILGKDEWYQEKHNVVARRTWGKLHLALNEHHEILACELTTPEVGDPSVVPALLDHIAEPFQSFMGDGAYDAEPVSTAELAKQLNAKVVVPPHRTAVCSSAGDTERDKDIRDLAQHGRLAWKK